MIALIWYLPVALQEVTIDSEKVETTPGQPFYTQDRGWVNAADLKFGEHVFKADGSVGIVKANRAQVNFQRMYNLTVDKAHTFFVGQQQWLVHNLGENCEPFPNLKEDTLDNER